MSGRASRAGGIHGSIEGHLASSRQLGESASVVPRAGTPRWSADAAWRLRSSAHPRSNPADPTLPDAWPRLTQWAGQWGGSGGCSSPGKERPEPGRTVPVRSRSAVVPSTHHAEVRYNLRFPSAGARRMNSLGVSHSHRTAPRDSAGDHLVVTASRAPSRLVRGLLLVC